MVCQWSAGHLPVADVTVRQRNELDMVAKSGPFCRRTANLEFTVVRVGAKGDDAEFAVWSLGMDEACGAHCRQYDYPTRHLPKSRNHTHILLE